MSRVSVDAGIGHESLSSPLIRVSPNAPLILVDGLNRLAGNYVRGTVAGMRDWTLAGNHHFTVSGRGDWKRAPSATDLDFGMASADAMWRSPVGGYTAGIGPSVQRLWVAGDRFRDVTSMQADVTRGMPDGGYWAWLAGLGVNRHRGIYADLDSRAAAVSGHRRIVAPFSGVSAIDLEFGVGRELNRHDFTDLANRNAHARVSVDRRVAGIDWAAGFMVQRARFDAALFEGLPARRDRYRAVDLVASLDLDKQRSLRVEAMVARNDANLPMFENRYRQISLTLSSSY